VPAGVSDGAYYSCVSCYPGQSDAGVFDSQKFATALHDRIFEPARHAVALLARWPYLTRLFTTISPGEMTLDPFFEVRTGLDPVSLPGSATWRRTMTSASGFQLPGGEQVALDGSNWPAFTNAMPWAERIDSYPLGQASQLIADNSGAIGTALDAWNQSQGWPMPPPSCPSPTGASGFAGAAGSGGFLSGSAGTGTIHGSAGTGSGGTTSGPPVSFTSSSDSGCGVSRAPSRAGSIEWLAAIGAVAALRRRRRSLGG
jgi:hypothetical protein